MRAFTEHPRVAIAKTLGVLCLVAAGVVLGTLVDRGSPGVSRASEVRLASAQRSAQGRRAQLRVTQAELERASTTLARVEQQMRALRRANTRLRHELRAARRARRRANRPH